MFQSVTLMDLHGLDIKVHANCFAFYRLEGRLLLLLLFAPLTSLRIVTPGSGSTFRQLLTLLSLFSTMGFRLGLGLDVAPMSIEVHSLCRTDIRDGNSCT